MAEGMSNRRDGDDVAKYKVTGWAKLPFVQYANKRGDMFEAVVEAASPERAKADVYTDLEHYRLSWESVECLDGGVT